MALSKIMSLQSRAKDKIVDKLKGDKPFAKEEIKWSDVNNDLDSIDNIQMNSLINEFGFDIVNNTIGQARINDKRRKV
jgi:hypothetical protein